VVVFLSFIRVCAAFEVPEAKPEDDIAGKIKAFLDRRPADKFDYGRFERPKLSAAREAAVPAALASEMRAGC
jgi:hypothetical protein